MSSLLSRWSLLVLAAALLSAAAVQAQITTFPHTETFDAAASLPTGWSLVEGGGDTWQFTTSAAGEPFSGATVDHTTGSGNFAWLNDSQPPIAVDARLVTPVFDVSGLTSPRLRFWYQNVRNAATTRMSTMRVLVSADGGATFATALTISNAVASWTEYAVDLTPYASTQTVVAFAADEAGPDFQTNSDPSLDDVTVEEAPAGPVFTLSPDSNAGAVSFGTAGACDQTTTQAQTFTATNSGGGSITISTASVSGAGYSVDTASLPVTLGAGESMAIPVTFAPSAGATGTQAGTLTVTYDDGTASTATVSLTATATATNVNLGQGAGYSFANSSACAAGTDTPGPAGTDFIDVTGHTYIGSADWSDGGKDAAYAIDEATLDGLIGSIRFFGREHESFAINTNGAIAFDETYGANPPVPPTSAGGGLLYVGAMDLGLTSAYDGDNTGVARAGVYVGAADVDGDSDDELVVTYFHAYDYFAPSYPASNARYFTAQLIVFKADAPNQDDAFEIRYYDGNDANGVPFHGDVTSGGFPPISQDLIVGLANPEGTAAATYRVNGVGGPLYAEGGGSVAIRFSPQTQALANGAAGWRMMGVPVTGYTVGRLAELNLVQRVAGQYPTHPDANLFTAYDGTDYLAATEEAEALTPGQGFLWYLFDATVEPDPATAGGGTSMSYALPMALQGTGAESTGPVSVALHADVGGTTGGFNMVANPFRSPLDVTPATVASWAQGGTLTSAVGQVWDPATASFIPVTSLTTPNVITAWQGMFIENADATSLSVPASAKTTGGAFVGRQSGATAQLAFELAGTTADGGATLDRAATLYLTDGGTDGWDVFDASKLTPLAGAYATLAFVGSRDGETRLKAQESRPLDAASFEVPLVVDAVGTEAALTLTWPTIDGLPAAWGLELRDLETGATVDLRAAERYTFEVQPEPADAVNSPADLLARATAETTARTGHSPRLALVVTTGRASAVGDGVPVQGALAPASPNPLRDRAEIRYALPEADDVSLAVFDLLGRRVATLVEGPRNAGWHTATVDASALSAGVYVVRMQAGAVSQTQRITVAR